MKKEYTASAIDEMLKKLEAKFGKEKLEKPKKKPRRDEGDRALLDMLRDTLDEAQASMETEKATAPIVEEPIVEEPNVEEPNVEEPTIETVEEVIEEPIEQAPVLEEKPKRERKPRVRKPKKQEPPPIEIEEPIVEEPIVEEPIVEVKKQKTVRVRVREIPVSAPVQMSIDDLIGTPSSAPAKKAPKPASDRIVIKPAPVREIAVQRDASAHIIRPPARDNAAEPIVIRPRKAANPIRPTVKGSKALPTHTVTIDICKKKKNETK